MLLVGRLRSPHRQPRLHERRRLSAISFVRSLRPHEKYAWVLLFLSSALFLPTSVFFVHSFFVMPYVASTGDLSHVLAGSPWIATWMRGIFRDTAIAQLGLAIFG